MASDDLNRPAIAMPRTVAPQELDELPTVHRASTHLQRLQTADGLAQEIVRVLEETLAYDLGAVLTLDEASGRRPRRTRGARDGRSPTVNKGTSP